MPHAKRRPVFWEVKESILQHSCDPSEQRGRKRGIKSEHIREFVPAVDSIALVGAKSTATVRDAVAKGIGVELKPSQALLIAKAGSLDPTAVAVNEFHFIESYISKLQASDPNGTYKKPVTMVLRFNSIMLPQVQQRTFGNTAIATFLPLMPRS